MRAIPNLPWTALPPTVGVSGKPGQLQTIDGAAVAASARRVSREALALHASTRDAPVDLSDSSPELISTVRQPVLLAASRCYLIQMLRSALTCANGCSCWSTGEENSTRD